LVPYGSRQSRRLVTETAFHAEVGHNVTPENRIGHLEGYAKAATFPVFYEDRLADILWCLDYEGVKAGAAAQPTKRTRRQSVKRKALAQRWLCRPWPR
jgi:hypothetical protein